MILSRSFHPYAIMRFGCHVSLLWIVFVCPFSQILKQITIILCLLEILHWPHTQSSLSIHELWEPYHHHPSWILILQPLLALIHQLFHFHLFKLLLLKMLAVMGGY